MTETTNVRCPNRQILPGRRSSAVLRLVSAAALAAVVAASASAAEQADTPQTGLSVEREVCRFLRDPEGRLHVGCDLESEVDMKPPATGTLIYELNAFPSSEPTAEQPFAALRSSSEPTAEQQRAADKLLATSFASAKAHGWLDVEQALADGYQPMRGERSHYMNTDFINDEHVLDPQRPEFLMYTGEALGWRLLAFMFVMNSPEDEGPQIGGPLTRWHFHTWSTARCFNNGRNTHVLALADGTCAVGTPSNRGPQMMHVWFLPHPGGRFATRMSLRRDVLRKLLDDRPY